MKCNRAAMLLDTRTVQAACMSKQGMPMPLLVHCCPLGVKREEGAVGNFKLPSIGRCLDQTAVDKTGNLASTLVLFPARSVSRKQRRLFTIHLHGQALLLQREGAALTRTHWFLLLSSFRGYAACPGSNDVVLLLHCCCCCCWSMLSPRATAVYAKWYLPHNLQASLA